MITVNTPLLSGVVQFSGSVVAAEKVKDETLIFIDPPDLCIQALTDMPGLVSKCTLSYQ